MNNLVAVPPGSLSEAQARSHHADGFLVLRRVFSPKDVLLALPGPAAAVQHVPPFSELSQALRCAGFVDLAFEKLSPKAFFEIGGVGLREVLLAGRKPGHRAGSANHAGIYLGPLTEVTDDYGNIFPRGEQIALNIHDWLSLKNGSVAAQFLLLAPDNAR